jgi:hypothetical protein
MIPVWAKDSGGFPPFVGRVSFTGGTGTIFTFAHFQNFNIIFKKIKIKSFLK